MCGIAGIFGKGWEPADLCSMATALHHRGPDGSGVFISPLKEAGLGHTRLSIIDLSASGRQPMYSHDERLTIVFNGEVYNYLELRDELSDYPYQSRTDTEVVLAAYERWGEECLEHFIGMFAFLIWDRNTRKLFAARDRFGVKPLYYSSRSDGTLLIASEIKALHAAGVVAQPDAVAWATYLAKGIYDNSERTFWQDIRSLRPGHLLTWQNGEMRMRRWYDLAARAGEDFDERPAETVCEEYLALLNESVRLRFRSDVPVGINLSGGLDSSTLLGLVQSLQGANDEVGAYTFITGERDYDELPWVVKMLERTRHPLSVCEIKPDDVPALATSVQDYQDEPFGGLPTLCYARLFERARAEGVKVLLDGQGMDEQWAGYDYYVRAACTDESANTVQGTNDSPVRPECLAPEFRALAEGFKPREPFPDRLRNLQYRDALHTKMPRALRFNDRVSMRSSTELREPFLDHRLFELALRQPPQRKIGGRMGKLLLREMAGRLLPKGIVEAPKRPVQTPQREWLRGQLRDWADDLINLAMEGEASAWLEKGKVREAWRDYLAGASDNSFFVWQWISLGLMDQPARRLKAA